MVSLRARGKRLSALAATTEDSKGALALRALIGVLVAAGAALLVWAEWSTLYQIKAGQVILHTGRVGHHNSYALVPIAVLALLMGYGGVVGRSRAAMAAVFVLGIAALLIALLVDRPDTNAEGLWGVRYLAHASAREGLTRELIGGALLALAGAGGFIGLTWLRRRGNAGSKPAETA